MPDPNDPIWRLPPYTVESVSLATGQQIPWSLEMFDIPNLWPKVGRGKGVKVAICDTGAAFNHPDFSEAVEDARDFTGSRAGPADLNGHGTWCAGCIGGRDDAMGVVGVAPECTLLIAKVLGDSGSGSSADVAAGISWAIAKGADVISLSLGSQTPDEVIRRALAPALEEGITVVCAAGNDGPSGQVGFPARWPGMESIAAHDRSKQLARFSSRGERIDVAAPGVQVLGSWPPNSVGVLSGTSMATPFVAGVVALLIAYHKATGHATPLKPSEILERLRSTATDAGPSGPDTGFGAGIINPAALLATVVPVVGPPPVGPPPGPIRIFVPPGSDPGNYTIVKINA